MATAYSLLSRFRAISTPASRVFANRAFSVGPSPIPQLRTLVSVSEGLRLMIDCHSATGRCFSTRSTTSSIKDPSPNWSNRPPKETILLDGCDFEHWLVVVEKPDEKLTRDEIIDSYIKTLAQVVGSEEEARMKIYSVSTKHYFAFGALVSEELSYKIKALPGVRWVLPDSYLNVKEKNYGGEPFIDGQAVPYDPKYHEEWVRNNSQANNRPGRRPRKPFERPRMDIPSREFQTREAPPMPNFQNAASPPQSGHNVPPKNSPIQMHSNPNAFPNQVPNVQPGFGYQPGPPQSAQPSGQGYQSGPPTGQGFQAGVMGNQGYQAGPPSIQGYQAGPPGSQGYQSGPPSGHGYQSGPPTGQGFQAGVMGNQAGPPGVQGYQAGATGSQGYRSGPPSGQGYQVSPPGGQGYQASQPGSQGYQASPHGGLGYQASPDGQCYQPGPLVGQAYQTNQSVGQGYQVGPPRNPMYSVGQPSSSTPYYGGNQASQEGPTGGPATSQGNFGSSNYLNGNPSNPGNGAYNQGGGNGGFQGGQPGASAYQGGNPPKAARDIPGRDI